MTFPALRRALNFARCLSCGREIASVAAELTPETIIKIAVSHKDVQQVVAEVEYATRIENQSGGSAFRHGYEGLLASRRGA